MNRLLKVIPDPTTLDYNENVPRSLGCSGCIDLEECGGNFSSPGPFDCLDLCTCESRSRCPYVCPNKPDYVARYLEVDGYRLDRVPRAKPARMKGPVGPYVPIVQGASSRKRALQHPSVALPLMHLIDSKRSTARFRSRAELTRKLQLRDDVQMVLTGVAQDADIERWWHLYSRRAAIRALREFGVALVTSPNYSLVLDAPRHDNLHALKRIVITWAEFMEEGVPTALHLNARTATDYEKLTRFVADRPEANIVACEYLTGPARATIGSWQTRQLVTLARSVSRPLTLVTRGGQRWLPELTKAFHQVMFLDAAPHQRAKFRRIATVDTAGKLRWQKRPTAANEPIDDLLEINVAVSAKMIGALLTSRADAPDRETIDRPLLAQACAN